MSFDVEVTSADERGLELTADGPVGLDVRYGLAPASVGAEMSASVRLCQGGSLPGRLVGPRRRHAALGRGARQRRRADRPPCRAGGLKTARRPAGGSVPAIAEQMTRDQWHAFVMEGTPTGKFAVTRKDGTPHVLPVWFVLDGDDFLFNTGEDTVRGRSLRRDGRGCMLVDDERPPYAFLKAEGRAELMDDLDESLRVATLIGARYMGAERAEEFGRRNAVPGELLVRFRPERVFGQLGVAT